MKTKRALTSFLLLVSILMLAVPVMPHHHHTDGLMCMKNDIASDCCDCPHHTEESTPLHHCCENSHCASAFFVPDAPANNDCDFRPTYLWVNTLFYELVFELLLSTENKGGIQFSCYIESLHSTQISTDKGLRAPPVALT